MLKNFKKYWSTPVLPGDRGSPNYKIKVSFADGKKWLPVNYDTYMSIPLDETKFREPDSGRKAIKEQKDIIEKKIL